MLESTLAEEHAAGAHLLRPATGAGWAFLLPSLSARAVLCLGAPSPAAAALLERVAAQVIVVDGAGQVPRALAELRAEVGAIDLVAVCRRRAARRVLSDVGAVAALAASLSEHAVVFEEGAGPTPLDRVASTLGVGGGAVAAWLTPAFGDVRAATPDYSSRAAAWLRAQGLDKATLDERVLIDLRRRYRSRLRPAVASPSKASGDDLQSAPGGRALGATAARRRVARWLTVAGRLEARIAQVSSRARRRGQLTGEGVTSDLPLYVRRAAAEVGLDLAGHDWVLVTPGDYENQKVLFFAFDPGAKEPGLVVKVARSDSASARLERAATALASLHGWRDLAGDVVPRLAFCTRHQAFAICAESVVHGSSFQSATAASADCALVRDALDWLTRLGAMSARSGRATEAAAAMTKIVDRLDGSYEMSSSHIEMLRAHCDEIAAAGDVKTVFAHGDPGTWNLIAKRGGGVAFLDWENAEPASPPLWDLFYLLRSYATLVARGEGASDRHSAATSSFLGHGPLQPLLESSIDTYCTTVDVPRSLVGPLFHLCWAMHAVKAATRLSPWDRERGAHISFLRRMLDERDNATLRGILEGSTA
ncbi:MAG: hypothetical protein ACOYXM_10795 [Actinomycetota bacterium]